MWKMESGEKKSGMVKNECWKYNVLIVTGVEL